MTFDNSAYRFDHIPPLTDDQLKSPFARFYYEPVTKPAPAVMAAIGETQLDPAEALAFQNIERLFRPEGNALKNGWCVLPDGTGYSLITTEMPGVTPAAERWWSRWMLDPDYDWLNYRIWMPGLHVSHAMPIVEDLGWGPVSIQMFQPLFPSLLGLSAAPQELDSAFFSSIGSSGRSWPAAGAAQAEYNLLFNVIKRAGDGMQVLTVNYAGVKWEEGRIVKMHDADPDHLRLFATHNAYEFQRKANLAPELYAYAQALPDQGLNPNVKPPVLL